MDGVITNPKWGRGIKLGIDAKYGNLLLVTGTKYDWDSAPFVPVLFADKKLEHVHYYKIGE